MKYAVVTGSTKGIGKAIAEKFLQEDFFVFVNYNRDDEACEKFKNDNKQYSDKFEVIKEDLSSYENAQSFIEKIKEKTNSIDALVLNCGVTDRSKFEDISKESWEHVMNVNVNVPFYLVQGFKSIIVESGSVVFVGSTLGKFPHATSLSYGVTKAAIQSMAKNLVKFFEDKAVTVNAVAPGFVETEWQKNKPAEIRNSIESKIALHRFADPAEIANLVYHITKNKYINGSVVDINGGYCYR